MRKLPFISFVSGCMLAGSTLAAAPSPASYSLDADQLHELEGVYKLSNGKKLRLTLGDGRLYAELGRHQRVVLMPVGPNSFASPGGMFSIVYKPQAPDNQIVVNYTGGTTTLLAQAVRGNDQIALNTTASTGKTMQR